MPAGSIAPAPAKTVDPAPATSAKTAGPASAPAAATEKPTLVKPAMIQDGQPQETDEERQFVELVNQERARRGLGKLTIDPLLIAVAREHSAEMRDKNYFNHVSPTQGIHTPMDRYLKAIHIRPGYACVGENLYWCSVTDVQRGHNAFMNSPTHRENLLFPRYEKIGVGIVKDARGEFWVTEMFLTNSDPQLVAKKVARSH